MTDPSTESQITLHYTDYSADIVSDADTGILSLIFKARPLNDEFIPLHEKLIHAFLDLKRCTKFFVDTRKAGAISDENQLWVARTMFPAMVNHLDGLTLYHGQLLSENIFTLMASEKIRNSYRHPKLIVQSFKDHNEAMSWMLNPS